MGLKLDDTGVDGSACSNGLGAVKVTGIELSSAISNVGGRTLGSLGKRENDGIVSFGVLGAGG